MVRRTKDAYSSRILRRNPLFQHNPKRGSNFPMVVDSSSRSSTTTTVASWETLFAANDAWSLLEYTRPKPANKLLKNQSTKTLRSNPALLRVHIVCSCVLFVSVHQQLLSEVQSFDPVEDKKCSPLRLACSPLLRLWILHLLLH